MSKAKYIAGMVNSSGDVTNTSLTNSLDLKAPLASPTFTGTVSGITKSMVGLGNVDNTTDLLKPISTATQTALNLKANQSTTYTKTEADAAISNLVAAAPGALDTLNELATALGNDPNFATTVTNSIALKAPLASPTLTGTTTATNLAYTGTLTGSTGVLNIGSGQVYKDASGNVGIGTISASLFNSVGGATRLAVCGSSASTDILGNTDASICIINTDTTANNTAGLHFARADTDDTPNLAGASIVAQFPDTQVTNQYPKGLLAFLTSTNANAAPSEKMRIDSSGNVGIGTSSPSSYGRLAVMTPTATYGYFGIANSSGGGGGLQMAQYYGTTKISYIDSILSNGTPGSETAGLAFATASVGTLAERMRIDSSGYITKPYQPMASVNYTGASIGAFNPILYNNVLLNDGNCYNSSTGRFTCPVAGRYRVQANDMSVFQAATGCYLIVNKNGSAVSGIGYSRADGVAHNHASITAIIQCAVGDYLTLQQATSSFGNGYNHATFEFIG